MSWEEYKKRREEESSWEQYKKKRESQLQESKTSISNTQSTSLKETSNNKTSLWDNIQNLASGTGKVADNLWQSLKNGVMSLQQTVGRAANNTQADSVDLINKMNKRALEGRLKDNPEEAEQINKIINNPLISGDKIREESEEYYNKIQEKKNENTLKIQQNAESINNQVGKYIAGEIAPSIGQMLPGMVGGPIGTTYFIGSATGNYYDDAKQRGMTEDQATMYSGVMGIIEGSLEAVGAKLTTNVGKQLLKKNIKGALVNYGLDIGENFLEESIVEPLSEIVATTTAGKDKADWSNMGQRMWESGIAGAITSLITGGSSAVIGGIGSKVSQQNKYVDYSTNEKLDKNTQNILKQAEDIIEENKVTNSQQQTTQNEQTSVQQTNPYKNTAKANKLIKEKNNQIREIQSQIEQTDSIETKNKLQEKIKQIESEYNTKIQELYDNTNQYVNLQQNNTNNRNNANNQQITQSQQENAKNGISEPKNNNYISEEFKKGLEQFKSGKYTKHDNIVLLNETPQWLYNKGYDYEQPIVINMDKLSTIMKEPKGKFNGKNQHGITMDLIEQLPEAINNPLNVIKNPKFNNRYVVVTSLGDQYGDIVLVPIEMNDKGYISGIETDVNRVSSMYGKEYYDLPKNDTIASYMERNKDNIVYDIDTYNKSSNTTNDGLQLPLTSSVTTSNNSIPQNTKNVNGSTTNNYSMQESENNSGSFSMPTKQNTIKLPKKESNVDKYNRYKQNILKGRGTEVNNLIKNKNETINKLEEQIAEKKQLLNSKKDKTTNVANNLKMQIESLEQRRSKIESEYNSRIDRKFAKATKDIINFATKKEMGITRKEIQQNLLEDTEILNESLDNANNITMLNMNRTDPIRLQEKVFGKELGSKINDMFFNKVKHNTAEKTRFLNRERADIKDWGIKARSFESEILQKYTEKSYIGEDGKEIAYTDANLAKDIPSQETRDTIKKASKELRKKYDNYIDTANEVLVGLGYDAIPKRKDYVRHFTELNDIFTQFGIPGKFEDSLPTDINGITDTFRPGKNFFANAQKRHGNKTTYDAITGIDGYIEGISNLIYHTEDIQRLRAFDKYIRDTYGASGFENLDNLTENEKKARIEKISENHLSNYASWLTEYTNNLAGKKSGIDRSIEKLAGRNIYSALNAIKRQTGSNMTGFNLGSALTNFISVAQGASKSKKLALLKGTANTIQNIFINDGFVDKSDFLTNRFGSNKISNTAWEKISNAGQIFMTATDYFSSNVIVRSKYYENLAKGMSEADAIKSADDFGARILGDRSQGATANVFNSKMLGIVTQFQLETNNQMDTMIHDTIQDFKTTREESGTTKATMGAVWTLGQMAVYQHAFNNIFEAVAGRRPAFDIIDIIKTALGLDDDEDNEDTIIDNLQQASTKLIESLPFINLLSEDARVPIASALPNPVKIATGDSTLKDEMSKLVYLLPPTGGSQAKKSIEGIKTVIDGGSYVTNADGEKELRFPVENANALDYIKAGVFGKYSLPLAQEYINKNYKRLSAKQTKTYKESNLPYKEYLEYIEAGLKKTVDKINYLESKDITTEQKWGIYKNDLFSDTIREDDGGSQLKDAEYITSNGVSKSEYIKLYNKAKKNEIDMPTANEYKEMKSNSISLSSYIDYKIKVKNLTESKRNSNELSKEENLKNTDKIQILLDSNFFDKEISSLYASYIKSEKDTEYDIMKSAGIDIKEYLKYKQQDFESDYYDDGTLKGKTVSKSKQKKVVAYLNSMKIKGNQRLLLYAMQGYSMTSSQKTQLAHYVKRLDIDNDTKLKLYDKFSGFKVYKNGQVRW